MRSELQLQVAAAATAPTLTPAVAALLARVFADGEEMIATVEAVEIVRWRERVAIGGAWAFSHLVLLVVTNHRLLEIALKPGGTTPAGRVREVAWSRTATLHVDGATVRLGDGLSWLLRQPLANEVVVEVARIARSEAMARRSGATKAWRLCSACGLTATSDLPSCRRCGVLRHSATLATLLAWTFPGAGMLYLDRPVFAALRLLVESGCFALLTWLLMVADGLSQIVLVAAAGVPVFLLVKLESATMTRAMADRTGTITVTAASRWRRLALASVLVTALIGALPFFLTGRLSTTLTSDLDAVADKLGWTVSRTPTAWAPQPEMDVTRAQWRHRDGWLLRATAEPFAPFESANAARSRLLAGATSELTGRPEEITGDLAAISRLERDPAGGDRLRVSYAILDEAGRDCHFLSTEIAATDLAALDVRVRELLPALYWTPDVRVAAMLTASATDAP